MVAEWLGLDKRYDPAIGVRPVPWFLTLLGRGDTSYSRGFLIWLEDPAFGFRAESYHVDLAEGFDHSRQIMDIHIRTLVRSDIGGDEQRISSIRTQHDNVTFKHILLPVWISAYRYKDKIYRFLINGRTGEVQGERPWSWAKIVLLVAGVLCAAAAVAAIFVSSQ